MLQWARLCYQRAASDRLARLCRLAPCAAMKRALPIAALLLAGLLVGGADAHFLVLLPSADVVERAMYNGVLSGIDLSGEKFFYVNPLASDGGHHRQPFFGCACCPTNVVRLVPSVPGYVYAQGKHGICVNLYVAGKAKIVSPRGTPI